MVNKLQPDVVMCGPAFNFADYAGMCAKVACDINATTKAKAFAAMSAENEDTIAAYKDKVAIVKTPKKGGMGLNDALKNMCTLAKHWLTAAIRRNWNINSVSNRGGYTGCGV